LEVDILGDDYASGTRNFLERFGVFGLRWFLNHPAEVASFVDGCSEEKFDEERERIVNGENFICNRVAVESEKK
jgi:hypothetical protein